MNQLAVFPSDLVARWVEPESLERERDREHSFDMEGRDAEAEGSDSQVSRLRYRPFERLFSVRTERAS